MNDPRPIGVFDSGVGGLTVYRALRRRMPEESLVYFGDTGHLPYGSKSAEAVTRFSLHIARFLESRGIKLLVVACNTASAVALDALRRRCRVPVLGVIGPGARAAAAATRSGTVGVIATEGTVSSGAYQRALKELLPAARVRGVSCPLFVPLVEEGWWEHAVTRAVAREYLDPFRRTKADTLILGCTHYPMLKTVIQKAVGRGVRLIDSAEQAAIEAEGILTEMDIRRTSGTPKADFYVSDGPGRFKRLARRLGVAVREVRVRAFD